MPHLVIECSDNLLPVLVEKEACRVMHGIMFASGLFAATGDIKVRLHGTPHVYIGDKGTAGRFIHGIIYLLEGRSLAQRAALTKAVADAFKKLVPDADSITLDARELTRDTYQKL